MLRGDRAKAEAAFMKAVDRCEFRGGACRLANFRWASATCRRRNAASNARSSSSPRTSWRIVHSATFYMGTRRAELAEPHFKTVAEVAPGPEAKFALADYYLRLGMIDSARDVLTPMTADKALFVEASVRLANLKPRPRRMPEAHRILDGVLARDPKNASALLLRGKLFLAENNTVNALYGAADRRRSQSAFRSPRSLALAQTHALRGSTQGSHQGLQRRAEASMATTASPALAWRDCKWPPAAADAVPLLTEGRRRASPQPRSPAAAAPRIHGHRRHAASDALERPAEDQCAIPPPCRPRPGRWP